MPPKREADHTVDAIGAIVRESELLDRMMDEMDADEHFSPGVLKGEGLVESARRELAGRGIDVNLLMREAFPDHDKLRSIGRAKMSDFRKMLIADFKEAKGCDKIDYSIAAFAGVVSGFVDALLVGIPGDSVFGADADELADKLVIAASNLIARPKNENGKLAKATDRIDTAIKWLEEKFEIYYDQTRGNQVKGLVYLTPCNHHLKSLGHAPDWIGLLFSIINQFTDTSSFVETGKLVTIDTEHFELKGHTILAKLFSAFCNWLGHVISDLAGSSSTRAKGEGHRGMGVCAPYYELTQFFAVGEFGKNKESFAEIATKVFESGYDLRHLGACAVPVALNELIIRFSWAIRQYFTKRVPVKKCIPSAKHLAVNRMLLTGYACFCAIDAADAGLRGGGELFMFMMRCNYLAWFRFGRVAERELMLRVDRERYIWEFHVEKLNKELKDMLESCDCNEENNANLGGR